jgi:hypothetical protein
MMKPPNVMTVTQFNLQEITVFRKADKQRKPVHGVASPGAKFIPQQVPAESVVANCNSPSSPAVDSSPNFSASTANDITSDSKPAD